MVGFFVAESLTIFDFLIEIDYDEVNISLFRQFL